MNSDETGRISPEPHPIVWVRDYDRSGQSGGQRRDPGPDDDGDWWESGLHGVESIDGERD